MNLLKKLFVYSVVITTVLWSVGASFAPLSASAAGSYPAGSLLAMKGQSGAAVYLVGTDAKKHVFPSMKEYSSWYPNFDKVVRVTVAELDMYPDGAAVTVRPGTKLVTHMNTAKVYAIEPGGNARWIATDTIAKALYGNNWTSRLVDVIPGFFAAYKSTGTTDISDKYPTGTVVKMGTTMYYIDGTTKRAFASDAAYAANGYVAADAVTVTALTGLTDGTSITGAETAIKDFTPNADAPVVVGGSLNVSLSPQTTAQMNIPYNVKGFVYTSLKLTAGSSAVDVTGVTVKRLGLGDNNDFDKVYVEVDGLRHGTKRTLGSDNTVDINFATSASKITIPAGQTITLNVVADQGSTDTDAGHYNALQVTALQTNGSVSGSLPLAGNYMTINSISVATATVSFDGSAGEITVGENQVEVGVFTVDNASANEDISFEAIVLENSGTADNTEVVNYTLYNEDGESISNAMNATGDDYVLLTLKNAMTIADGESHEFTVKADVSKGKDETVVLGLDEVTDFQATGLSNGYAVTATDKVGDDSYLIVGGDLTINEASTNPATQDVSPKTDNVVFLIAELESADETSVITNLSLTCTGNVSCVDLEDVTVYLNDVVVGGPEDGAATIAFTDEFEVAGSKMLKVVADVGENASGTYSIALASSGVTVEDIEGDALTDSGSATGNNVVVGTDSATLSKDNTYGNQTMVAGDEGFLIGRFVLEASDYEGVKISNYKVHLAFGAATSLDDVDQLWISEDTDKEDNLAATTTFTVSQTLAAGATKVISVYATVDSNYTVSGTATDSIQVDKMSVTTKGLVSDDSNTVYNAVAGQVISIDAGTLTLSNVADEDMEAQTVIGGKTYEVGKWNFAADNVGYTITEVTVEAHNSNTTNTSAVTAAQFDGVNGSVINGVMTFDTNIKVARDEDKDLVLKTTFNSDFNTVTSGQAVEFAIVGYKYVADNDNGEEESTDYSSTGELMHVRKTDLGVTTAAADTTLTATTKIMKVTFTADASGKATVETATFFFNFHDDATVQGSSLTITNVQLKNSGGTIVSSSTTDYNANTNSAGVAVTLTGIGQEIAAGTSKTYDVVITVTNYATDDYINVKMMEDTGTTATYFGWGDDEATSLISGYLIKGLESVVYEANR